MNFPNGGKPVGLTRIAILQEKTQETLSADQDWIPCPKISYRPISLLPFILSCYRLGSLELANIYLLGSETSLSYFYNFHNIVICFDVT